MISLYTLDINVDINESDDGGRVPKYSCRQSTASELLTVNMMFYARN